MRVQDGIRKVSYDIAESVIKRIKPEALQRFGMKKIVRRAISDEAYLGPVDEALETASHILFEMEEDQLQQLEHRLKQCVLKVVDHGPNQDWVGTAFALCERGHILTAAHVLGEGHPLTISFQNESVKVDKWRDLVTSGYLNKEKDIAILKLDPQHWNQLRNAGLEPLRPDGTPPVLAVRDASTMRRDPVLCLGYPTPLIQGAARFVDPAPAEARVATHYPVRRIEFTKDGGVQECLVLVIAEGDERIVRGMSGGPILNLRTGEVIAMITGAERVGRIHQPFRNREEELPLAEYGFAVPLSDVADVEEGWPEFKECCLQGKEGGRGGTETGGEHR